jgi:hypothetical protein
MNSNQAVIIGELVYDGIVAAGLTNSDTTVTTEPKLDGNSVYAIRFTISNLRDRQKCGTLCIMIPISGDADSDAGKLAENVVHLVESKLADSCLCGEHN